MTTIYYYTYGSNVCPWDPEEIWECTIHVTKLPYTETHLIRFEQKVLDEVYFEHIDTVHRVIKRSDTTSQKGFGITQRISELEIDVGHNPPPEKLFYLSKIEKPQTQ